jgi:hypothetical protein
VAVDVRKRSLGAGKIDGICDGIFGLYIADTPLEIPSWS